MINYKYFKTLNFPLKTFLFTIVKVKNYKNFLPWCLDSFEKNHKSYDLTFDEIKTNHPELFSNKYINDYLYLQNELNKSEIKNEKKDCLNNEIKRYSIKTFEGYIKVGFDIIDFSYISKVYLICDNIVLSRTDDSQSNIFKKLESTWILKENKDCSEDKAKTKENSNFKEELKKFNNKEPEYEKINNIPFKNRDNNEYVLEEKNRNNEFKNIKESINVEYFIEFEMRSYIFRNLTSLCINFLGENIVKSFISETEKILKEAIHRDNSMRCDKNLIGESLDIKFKKMLKYKLDLLEKQNNEKLNVLQKDNLGALLDLFFTMKTLTYEEIERIIQFASSNVNLLYNLIFYSENFDKNNRNQILTIASEIKNFMS